MAIATLIRTPSVVGRFALTLNRTPPLSVAYLAGSLTAAGHDAQVIDGVGEAIGALHPSYRSDIDINGLAVDNIVIAYGRKPAGRHLVPVLARMALVRP
jgi:hypothetical protein